MATNLVPAQISSTRIWAASDANPPLTESYVLTPASRFPSGRPQVNLSARDGYGVYYRTTYGNLVLNGRTSVSLTVTVVLPPDVDPPVPNLTLTIQLGYGG